MRIKAELPNDPLIDFEAGLAVTFKDQHEIYEAVPFDRERKWR